jgi:hypothetical protein
MVNNGKYMLNDSNSRILFKVISVVKRSKMPKKKNHKLINHYNLIKCIMAQKLQKYKCTCICNKMIPTNISFLHTEKYSNSLGFHDKPQIYIHQTKEI